MCTPRTRLPRRSVSSESASSKSRADSGSQVKMNFFRDFVRFGDRSQKDETAAAEDVQRQMDESAPPPPEMHQDEIIIENLM